MQVQVGVLPELIFKQVVMQVPFSSIPGFWGTLLGLRHCREDSVGMFRPEKVTGAIWVVSLEVLRTEMISLQFWLISIEILASKSSDHTRVERPEKPLGKCFKIGVDFGIFWVSVDLACIFLDREERAPSFRKIRTRICAAKSKIHREFPP